MTDQYVLRCIPTRRYEPTGDGPAETPTAARKFATAADAVVHGIARESSNPADWEVVRIGHDAAEVREVVGNLATLAGGEG